MSATLRHLYEGESKGIFLPSDTIEEAVKSLADEFSYFEDWTERYQFIIDMGKGLGNSQSPWLHKPEHLLHGCQSQVWLLCQPVGDRLTIFAHSESSIVNGLIAILQRVYNGRTFAEIAATDPTFLAQLGLDDHLSPTRRNGLYAMVQAIRTIAAQLETCHG